MEQGLLDFGESSIVLSKDSTREQIRAYFEGVLKLYNSDDKFPVELDEVWPLVYSRGDKALNSLRRNFVECLDYILHQEGKVVNSSELKNGVKVNAKLSVECFEYFIARKVRSVFDVYRQVFKKVATGEVKVVSNEPKSGAELLLMYAQQMVENEKRVNQLERRVDDIEQRTATEIPYSTIVGYATRYGIRVTLNESSALGRSASAKCHEYGFRIDKVNDPRFGRVGSYPDGVLREVFSSFYTNISFD